VLTFEQIQNYAVVISSQLNFKLSIHIQQYRVFFKIQNYWFQAHALTNQLQYSKLLRKKIVEMRPAVTSSSTCSNLLLLSALIKDRSPRSLQHFVKTTLQKSHKLHFVGTKLLPGYNSTTTPVDRNEQKITVTRRRRKRKGIVSHSSR